MAENQQMLQREKEIMQGAKMPAQKVVTPPAKIKTEATLVAVAHPYSSPVGTPNTPALVGRASPSVISRDSIDSSSSER